MSKMSTACDLCGQKKIGGAKGGGGRQVRQCLYPPLPGGQVKERVTLAGRGVLPATGLAYFSASEIAPRRALTYAPQHQ